MKFISDVDRAQELFDQSEGLPAISVRDDVVLNYQDAGFVEHKFFDNAWIWFPQFFEFLQRVALHFGDNVGFVVLNDPHPIESFDSRVCKIPIVEFTFSEAPSDYKNMISAPFCDDGASDIGTSYLRMTIFPKSKRWYVTLSRDVDIGMFAAEARIPQDVFGDFPPFHDDADMPDVLRMARGLTTPTGRLPSSSTE